MLINRHFEVVDPSDLKRTIVNFPLGSLIVHVSGGMLADHLPFVLADDDEGQPCLQAHMPRVNPLYREISNDEQCLVLFHGPQGYVSPSYYASKAKHGKVVPTWNYSVVHVSGRIRLVEDTDWVRTQIETLTSLQENKRSKPWAVSDAPSDYIERMLKALVGVEISIEAMCGKRKASQNQPKENQRSLLEAVANEPYTNSYYEMLRNELSTIKEPSNE